MAKHVCVLTGGGGVLCSAIAEGLSRTGMSVALLDIDVRKARVACDRIEESGGEAIALRGDVLNRHDLEDAADRLSGQLGAVDVLINGVGGNDKRATTSRERMFFDLPEEGIRNVFDLNFLGTLLPCQVFGRKMADRHEGVIVNIASMNALRPLTHIPAYSAAKAAVANFTAWLAVHMAQEYSPRIRVNAIAPGFFVTDQNRFLLQQQDGSLTERGQRVLSRTPMARFGDPSELIGAVKWLVSSEASFVTGVVLPIDGGFSAYSGV